MKKKQNPKNKPILILRAEEGNKSPDKKRKLRSGDACPQCGQGRLDYDGLLNLSCAECGFAVGGCFT